MRARILATLLLFTPFDGDTHVYCPKAECEEVKQKIKNVESRMRQGYTRSEGEKLAAQLRKLRAIRSKKCR